MSKQFDINFVGSAARTILPVLRSRLRSTQRTLCAAVSAVVVTMASSGCQLTVNPFTDDLASQPAVTTPSVEGVRLADKDAPSDQRRSYERMQVRPYAGTVTHGPLYFADMLENTGSEDGRFAWTGNDYLLFLHGQSLFLLNGISWPLKVIVTPPWTVMSSDSPPHWTTLGQVPLPQIEEAMPVAIEPQALACGH